MDSTEKRSRKLGIYTNARKRLKQERLGMVARDGIGQHYTALTIPINIYLNPAA